MDTRLIQTFSMAPSLPVLKVFACVGRQGGASLYKTLLTTPRNSTEISES